MRLIDADKVDFNEVFVGASDFARETREAAKSLIDMQPTAYFCEAESEMSQEQECIAELFMLIENIADLAVKKDLSLFQCAGAGGCDMYQGMPPICRKKDDILYRYKDIIFKAVKNEN